MDRNDFKKKLEEISDIVKQEALKRFPAEDIEDEVYYLNANDGTDFDWNENDRSCEFAVYRRSDQYKAAQAVVRRGGGIDVYSWDYQNNCEQHYVDVLNEYEAYKFVKMLEREFDDKELWDKPVSEVL